MATRTPTPSLTSPPRTAAKPAWSWPHYLALAGLPILFWNAWTVIAWLADGPEQVTEYRDVGSFSWYAAKSIEVVTVIAALAVIVAVYRGCRRQRQILTFDVMFCLAGATIFWQNFVANFYAPIFLASSNFVNVNNTCGHMPFVVNPECGQAPDPLLFTWLLETFCILGMAMLFAKGVAWARRRWVGVSTVKLVGFVCLMGIFADVVIEPLILCALRVWSYQGPLGSYVPTGGNFQWSILRVLGRRRVVRTAGIAVDLQERPRGDAGRAGPGAPLHSSAQGDQLVGHLLRRPVGHLPRGQRPVHGGELLRGALEAVAGPHDQRGLRRPGMERDRLRALPRNPRRSATGPRILTLTRR